MPPGTRKKATQWEAQQRERSPSSVIEESLMAKAIDPGKNASTQRGVANEVLAGGGTVGSLKKH